MQMSWFDSWFPANGQLDRVTERNFRNQRARAAIGHAHAYTALSIVTLVIFNINNQLDGASWYNSTNVLRWFVIFILLITLYKNATKDVSVWRKNWFVTCLGCALLMAGVTLSSGLYWGRIQEGGIILTMMIFGYIPIFHLAEKCVFWLIILAGVMATEMHDQVQTNMIFIYAVATIVFQFFVQRELDLLQRLQYQSELNERDKAQTDQLTGAYNRHALEPKLNALIEALEPGEFIATLMLDIDHFKRYNDTYGHLHGDQALICVANYLKELPFDLFVRFGGEEFVAIKTYTRTQPRWLEEILQGVYALNIAHKSGQHKRITASAGLCIYQYKGEDRPSSQQCLAWADKLLYESKNGGRNRLTVEDIS